MNVNAVGSSDSGYLGLYEPWLIKAGKKPVPVDENGHVIGSYLLKAVDDAFKAYIDASEITMGAQLAGIVTYALAGGRSSRIQLLTTKDIAPFLALNLMA